MGAADLTQRQKTELTALAAMADDDIDTSDIPEIREFSNPRRGVFSGSPNRRAVPKRETAQRKPLGCEPAARPGIEEGLGRVPRFEEELSSISVKVDVRGLDSDTDEYGAHGVGT